MKYTVILAMTLASVYGANTTNSTIDSWCIERPELPRCGTSCYNPARSACCGDSVYLYYQWNNATNTTGFQYCCQTKYNTTFVAFSCNETLAGNWTNNSNSSSAALGNTITFPPTHYAHGDEDEESFDTDESYEDYEDYQDYDDDDVSYYDTPNGTVIDSNYSYVNQSHHSNQTHGNQSSNHSTHDVITFPPITELPPVKEHDKPKPHHNESKPTPEPFEQERDHNPGYRNDSDNEAPVEPTPKPHHQPSPFKNSDRNSTNSTQIDKNFNHTQHNSSSRNSSGDSATITLPSTNDVVKPYIGALVSAIVAIAVFV